MDIQIITREKETWFKITDSDTLRPFFMNVVSDSNHWMFISSNGGLSAGRKNSQYALFPYYTDDKITEFADITGSKSIFQIHAGNQTHIWEPFSERDRDKFSSSRNLYKNFHGNKILFEEINHNLGLAFRYQWNLSNLYGFVRKSELVNTSNNKYRITMLDGIQNIMPYGVEPDMQNATSNLVDAYKRNELLTDTGLGIYALSAIIVDKAEPSEALKANVAWSLGIDRPKYLVSSLQLDHFRKGEPVESEHDVKGEKGAYFIHTDLHLEKNASAAWKIIANVNQNHAQVIGLNQQIRERNDLDQLLENNIEEGTRKLTELTTGADGVRVTADLRKDARHYSNVLFNIMRGGTFDNNYRIEKKDLLSYLSNASREVHGRNQEFLQGLNETFDAHELYDSLSGCKDPDLYRLCKEYLPLKFSRRHGDPSRPWNQFSINTHCELDGSKILDYQGNWRDIFQNWEALVYSYPDFIEGMIFKFLNASTFDGYNPYRVTKGGFDWETIEPDNPWSYIGYWGDHQIIYLLKFLEFYQKHQPDALEGLFDSDFFAYANVPYRIKPYQEIAIDPKNTITFDESQDQAIRKNVAMKGADASLLDSSAGDIHRVNFLEKILATVLAKISNFIPEGGIWMNTQRPEWNDANNALVGNGVSMVTLYYLRRFLTFFEDIIARSEMEQIPVSEELKGLFDRIVRVLDDHQDLLAGSIDDSNRKIITDALGQAGSDYRIRIYENGFGGEKSGVRLEQISDFTATALKYLEHSIEANRRPDHLYHAYNLMSMHEDGISISHLDEMLEGQVAVLSSGFLGTEEAARLLDALRGSALYREDQNSYMLYPDKDLPRFLEKNNIPEALVEKSRLLQKLLADGNLRVINKDVNGGYHFNGAFRNARDVQSALEDLKSTGYKELVEEDKNLVLRIFEEVFNHKAFTGRSGTFFAYEGLGSIYWHMVSKLHLAVQEVCLDAMKHQEQDSIRKSLWTHYHEIGEGIGIHKSPDEYGAFPTDPYSHTPRHRGAQQPGMTGQVKEDILVSIGEFGVFVEQGILIFDPKLLRRIEFSTEAGTLEFVNVRQEIQEIQVPENALCFSCCQVPVVYQITGKEGVEVTFFDGATRNFDGRKLDADTSKQVFQRTGQVKEIMVSLVDTHLV
ncbi:MAG: hypothetical protein EA363_13050 [Balneolaceae bacterium]|nr:MAG: hypothetical protein EA363_13050 [Balneolaceae bacterium]